MNVDKNLSKVFIEQLEEILTDYKNVLKDHERIRILNFPRVTALELITRSRAAVERMVPRNSAYFKQSEEILQTYANPVIAVGFLIGVVKSLHHDMSKGYLQNFTELIHGELFADFLEMSKHLLDEGYKDAAAVIAGSALEAHLKQLCEKNGLETEYDREGSIQPKKADLLNSELAKAEVYSKQDQKSVTGWLGLRNDAAHGNYDKYAKEQVSIMIMGIRDFITRNPA